MFKYTQIIDILILFKSYSFLHAFKEVVEISKSFETEN